MYRIKITCEKDDVSILRSLVGRVYFCDVIVEASEHLGEGSGVARVELPTGGIAPQVLRKANISLTLYIHCLYDEAMPISAIFNEQRNNYF